MSLASTVRSVIDGAGHPQLAGAARDEPGLDGGDLVLRGVKDRSSLALDPGDRRVDEDTPDDQRHCEECRDGGPSARDDRPRRTSRDATP